MDHEKLQHTSRKMIVAGPSLLNSPALHPWVRIDRTTICKFEQVRVLQGSDLAKIYRSMHRARAAQWSKMHIESATCAAGITLLGYSAFKYE